MMSSFCTNNEMAAKLNPLERAFSVHVSTSLTVRLYMSLSLPPVLTFCCVSVASSFVNFLVCCCFAFSSYILADSMVMVSILLKCSLFNIYRGGEELVANISFPGPSVFLRLVQQP